MAKYIQILFTLTVFILVRTCTCTTTRLVAKQNCARNQSVLSNTSPQYQHVQSRGTLIKVERKRQLTDAYYDFLINEGSFKFWAVFQMVTIAILFYSTFAAIYYAKYLYLHEQPSEDDGDIFLRSIRVRTNRDLIRILKAINTPPH